MKHLVLVMMVGVLGGCGKEDSVQPSTSNTDTSSIKISKPLNKNSVTGVYHMVSPDGSKVTVQFDINGSFSASVDSEVVEQGLEWQIKDNKLYVFDRKLKQGEWYHAQYDIQENGDLIIKTVWDHGAGYPDGKPLRFEVPKNEQTPFRKIKFAETKAKAEAGDVISQFKLGMMYSNGEGVLEDDKEAVKWYRKAADQGYAYAQAILGVMYYNGEGVLKDDKEAVKWYRKAADKGNAPAQYNLGIMYYNGKGVLQDFKQAMKWIHEAADQGNGLVQNKAQSKLGTMYDNGEGVLEDDKEAVKWYKLAADQGYAPAQYNLGLMYDNGEGVLQGHNEAVWWYRKAAEQGVADAQYNLGIKYSTGQGVLQNFVTAYAWINIAEANGRDVKRFKELLNGKITLNQIAKSQELAKEMIKKNPKRLNR